MTTPTKEEIMEHATALYMQRNHDISCNLPELDELKEEGTYQEAQHDLMRSEGHETIDYLEEMAAEAGYKLVKKKKHAGEEQKKPDPKPKGEFDAKEALQSGDYISGTKGTGKSDLGMIHADELMKLGATVLVFDSTRDWINRSSIPNYISINTTEPFGWRLDGRSIIFDMSLLDSNQQLECVKAICRSVWMHQVEHDRTGDDPPENWIYLVFEEGHNYFPQGCLRAKAYAGLMKLVTGGRNYAIGFGAITQFAALMDKNVMRYMRQRFFGYTDEPNDIAYVTRFLGKPKQRDAYASKLMGLKKGQFLYKRGHKIVTVENKIYRGKTKPKPILTEIAPSQQAPFKLNIPFEAIVGALSAAAIYAIIVITALIR